MMGGITSFFSTKKSKSPSKDKNSSGMFASSKAKEIIQETKGKNSRDVDFNLNLKEARQVVEVVKSQRTARKLEKEARKIVDKSPPKKANFNRL